MATLKVPNTVVKVVIESRQERNQEVNVNIPAQFDIHWEPGEDRQKWVKAFPILVEEVEELAERNPSITVRRNLLNIECKLQESTLRKGITGHADDV